MTLFLVLGFIFGAAVGVWFFGVVLFLSGKSKLWVALVWPLLVLAALLKK